MRTFYKGGRQTLGLAVLIIAGILTVAWVRSQSMIDEIVLETRSSRTLEETYLFRSGNNGFRFVLRVWSSDSGLREEELCRIQYSHVVLPLTLLAAWLLLRKPRLATRAD